MHYKLLFLVNFKAVCGLLTFIIFCNTFTVTFAEENEVFADRFRKLSDELRCPTCQGLSVQDSDAGFSNSIKHKIRELMKRGKTDKEIKEFFVERYGEWLLRAPPKKGFNLVLWILPGAGIGIGLLWIIILANRWVTKPQLGDLAQLTPGEEKKLKEDLERFEDG